MLTPFGVGAYITSINGMVVLTSSEKLIADLAAAAKGGATLSSTMPKGSDTILDAKPVLLAFANISRLAEVILSTQQNLSMFTGGQSFVDQQQIDQMKKVGSIAGGLTVQSDAIKLRSVYEAPKM